MSGLVYRKTFPIYKEEEKCYKNSRSVSLLTRAVVTTGVEQQTLVFIAISSGVYLLFQYEKLNSRFSFAVQAGRKNSEDFISLCLEK